MTPPPVHSRAAGERGSVTVEMAVFVVPFLILLAMFIVFCGRAASASIDVNSAAAAAARSAADAPTPQAARRAATNAATATLASTRWLCDTATDTTAFRRGGTVTVTITCQIRLTDLGVAGISTTRTVRASATQPIDTYKAMALGWAGAAGGDRHAALASDQPHHRPGDTVTPGGFPALL